MNNVVSFSHGGLNSELSHIRGGNVKMTGTKDINVLVASRCKKALAELRNLVEHHDNITTNTRLITNGHSDPLYGLETLPDLLVFRIGENGLQELEELAARPAEQRRPMIVVSASNDCQVMRLAMQAGARDFFAEPMPEADFQASLERLISDCSTPVCAQGLTVVMNAKGGSGASLLASNVAHIMSAVTHMRVALVDFDLQFGALSHYLDLTPEHGLQEILSVVDELDETALDGYMGKHASGLRVLGSNPESVMLADEVPGEQLMMLLDLLESGYEKVIVDLPRQISLLSSSVIERADKLVLVVQQNIANLRDACRLLSILRNEFAMDDSKIIVVINRYDARAPITLKDIENALQLKPQVTIPNDFKHVSESLDSGIPLYESAKNAAITKSCMGLETLLGGHSTDRKRGLWSRLFHS